MTEQWTAASIPRLDGKLAVVTGANSGLGLETAAGLAAAGATVVMACRSPDKAQDAVSELRRRIPGAKLEVMALDLADLSSVRRFAQEYTRRFSSLDILCNNAGVMGLRYQKTRDGFEMLFGTNSLGHFALTGLLLDVLRKTPCARVVTLSSLSERRGRLPMDDLNWERRRYSKPAAYAQSKLANLVFALELDRRLRKEKLDVISVAAHPGYSATNIVYSRAASPSVLRRIWNVMAALGNTLLAQPASMGALPTLYAATVANIQAGDYIGPNRLFEFQGYPVRVKPSRRAQDAATGAALWQKAQELTGIRYL